MQPIPVPRNDDKGKILAKISAMVHELFSIVEAQKNTNALTDQIEQELSSRKSGHSLFYNPSKWDKYTNDQLKETIERLKSQQKNLSIKGQDLYKKIVTAKRLFHKENPDHNPTWAIAYI